MINARDDVHFQCRILSDYTNFKFQKSKSCVRHHDGRKR
jgi:hypothetical protein